ncbi:hypothetical protein AB6A40_001518 [Gnathostoma spinigerum]|uniref:BACK domain-containing protein n=1 Tax=Gnathostoma spinigerum TaxID=75299 RepID=A0ABD6EBT5_9BILA
MSQLLMQSVFGILQVGEINAASILKLDLSDLIAGLVTPTGLKAAIDFMYTGVIRVDINNLIPLLCAANVLAITAMVKKICDQACSLALCCPQYSFYILETAVEKLPRRSPFRDNVVDVVAQQFGSIRRNPAFLKLPMQVIYALYSSDMFYVPAAEALDSLFDWMLANKDKKYYAPNLIDNIDLSKLDPREQQEYLKRSESIDGLRPILQQQISMANWNDLLRRERLMFISGSYKIQGASTSEPISSSK